MNPEKHLLPKDICEPGKKNKKYEDPFGKLPFPSIDIIFNHKNIWANLQNPNPQFIKYHLHKVEDWMPLVTEPDPKEEHPRKQEKALRARLEKNNEDPEPPEEEDEEYLPKKGSRSKKGGKDDV